MFSKNNKLSYSQQQELGEQKAPELLWGLQQLPEEKQDRGVKRQVTENKMLVSGVCKGGGTDGEGWKQVTTHKHPAETTESEEGSSRGYSAGDSPHVR